MAILQFDPTFTDTLNANNPKGGNNDSNGFYVQLSWVGTIDDATGATSLSVKNTLFSSNNNFSNWTINSTILANGGSVSSVGVKRTLAKNSSVVVNNGAISLSGWEDTSQKYSWQTNNGGVSYYLTLSVSADGEGTATYIPNNASVGTTITVTKTGGTPPPTTYSVFFDSNGGSNSPSPFTNVANETSPGVFPSPGTRSGYNFSGWDYAYSVNSAIPAVSGSSPTYTAQWTAIPSGGINYTYRYSIDGVTGTPSGGTVASGTPINLGSAGTKSGYTFVGWYTDAGLTNAANNPHTIVGDTTFYAKWTSTTSTLPAWPSPLPALPQFIAGQSYTGSITASNMSSYNGVYSVSSGLPGGISINSSTGALTGTVTTGEDYSFTVSAKNDNGTITQNYSGTIKGILRVRKNDAWIKTVAKKREGEIWKPGTIRVWSNGEWVYGS